MMQEHFFKLADALQAKLSGDEVFVADFSAERSDFVRFNHSKVRQAGSVSQGYMSVDLIVGQCHSKSAFTVTGDFGVDAGKLDTLLGDLRGQLPHLADDPYLLVPTEVNSTEHRRENRLPDRDMALDAILAVGEGRDMVGIFSQGPIFAGLATSFGQRNWFQTFSFSVDWCFYLRADKAVKATYAGFEWDADAFDRKASSAVEQLAILEHEPKTIEPGKYRVYMAPAAMDEFVGMLGWDGVGLKAHRTKNTTLLRMIEDDATMAESVTICENTADGIAPNFQSSGFIKPPKVTLIENGRFANCLVAPRSAKEYSVATNAANDAEAPESLDMAAGTIADDEIVKKLDTGVYVNRLWYLNYSDRVSCRITGMTRFATFWVEKGQIVAPLNVMRFDETIYRALGENLIGLTANREFIPSTETYGGRSTTSSRVPGALIDDFSFTL